MRVAKKIAVGSFLYWEWNFWVMSKVENEGLAEKKKCNAVENVKSQTKINGQT